MLKIVYGCAQLVGDFSLRGQLLVNRSITTTSILNAAPPKKKKRIDPTVFRMRIERKIRKHETEIARIERAPKQPIPIVEYNITNKEQRELKSRPQHSLEEVGITQSDIKAAQRLWSFYRNEQQTLLRRSIRRAERAQERALECLKISNKELYDETVSVDDLSLIPYRSSHMRKETAPNAGYKSPDGYIKDVTKEWVM